MGVSGVVPKFLSPHTLAEYGKGTLATDRYIIKGTTARLPGVALNEHLCMVVSRQAGIATELFPDKAKMKKQMNYANAKHVPFVALAGESEMAEGKVTLKDMETGEQHLLTVEEVVAKLRP